MADKIVISTANPNDITVDEAEEIAQAIRVLNPDCDVQVEGRQRGGYGVTWFEVLRISLGGAVGGKLVEVAAKKVMDVIVDWVRKRFRGRKSASKRPVYVSIYGPDGIVKSVVIKNATDEPEDRTEEDRKHSIIKP